MPKSKEIVDPISRHQNELSNHCRQRETRSRSLARLKEMYGSTPQLEVAIQKASEESTLAQQTLDSAKNGTES